MPEARQGRSRKPLTVYESTWKAVKVIVEESEKFGSYDEFISAAAEGYADENGIDLEVEDDE